MKLRAVFSVLFRILPPGASEAPRQNGLPHSGLPPTTNGTPAPSVAAPRAPGDGGLFLDRRVFSALQEGILRHNARHPAWKIKEVRCMPCSVTRGLGLRSVSDLDGLVFYIQDRAGGIPQQDWAGLKTDLQATLAAAGIHFGGDYDPVSEVILVRVDKRQRIAGHLFLKDGRRMPSPQEEHISTRVLFRTDWRGRLVEERTNTRCNRPGPVLSVYHKNRGLSKCEARLRLAYLLGALAEADLREALTFDTPADEARLVHLHRLRQRTLAFLAARPTLSPAAAILVRQLHDAMVTETEPPLAFGGTQDPRTMWHALCELLRHRLIKVDAIGRGILPLWHQKQTLLVDDEQNLIPLPQPDRNAVGGRNGMLAQVEASAWRLDKTRITSLAQARATVTEAESDMDPFLRDQAVKLLGAQMEVRDLPLLIGVLGDQYDVAAGSAISLLARAEIPDLHEQLCRAIDGDQQNEAFCANAISVLGKRSYPDAPKQAAVVAFLERVVSGALRRTNAELRICYSGILALKRLSQQAPPAQASIQNYVAEIAAAGQTPKIIAGLIRDLFSPDPA